jgi:hypothetical protein
MPTADSCRWEQEVLGEPVQYPGHPVVLACMVMDRYPNLESATRLEPGRQFGNALSDNFIPGAGCAVRAALDTLRYAQTGDLGAAYAHATRYWNGWEAQDPANASGARKGREQHERIKARFEKQLETWGGRADPLSPYRVQLTHNLTGQDLVYWVARANTKGSADEPNVMRRHYGEGRCSHSPEDELSMRAFVAAKFGTDLPPRETWQ